MTHVDGTVWVSGGPTMPPALGLTVRVSSGALTSETGPPSQDRLWPFAQKMPGSSRRTWLTPSWSFLGERPQTLHSRALNSENPHLHLVNKHSGTGFKSQVFLFLF